MTMWIKEHLQLHKKQERLEEEKRLADEKKDKEEPVSDSEEQTNRGGKKRSAAKKYDLLLKQSFYCMIHIKLVCLNRYPQTPTLSFGGGI